SGTSGHLNHTGSPPLSSPTGLQLPVTVDLRYALQHGKKLADTGKDLRVMVGKKLTPTSNSGCSARRCGLIPSSSITTGQAKESTKGILRTTFSKTCTWPRTVSGAMS